MSDNPEKKPEAPAVPEVRRPALDERRTTVEGRPQQSAQRMAAPARNDDFEQMIEAWWSDHFPGSAVARDTSAWNHAMQAKDDLKRRLSERR